MKFRSILSLLGLLISVSAFGASPNLVGFTFNPTSIGGGGTVVATITLSAPAPANGAIVSLAANDPTDPVLLPDTVTVPAGQKSATFAIGTSKVSLRFTETIWGNYGVTKHNSFTITTAAPPALKSISLTPTSASVLVSGSQTFSATPIDVNGHPMLNVNVTYTSSNFGVAGIDHTGLATGFTVGTTVIDAFSGNVISNKVTLTVKNPPPPPPLATTRLSPNFGLVNMNGDFNALTILGTGFDSTATVNFGANVYTPTSVTPTSITVVVPATEFQNGVRTIPVTVTQGTMTTLALQFSVINTGFVSITFDDGYASAYKALPILDKAGIHSTFYTITSLVGDTADGYVTLVQLKDAQSRGHEIGNHSRTHPALSTISPTQLVSETSGAQTDLLTMTGVTPTTFAYPYDDYGASVTSPVVQAVKNAGVRGARDSDFGGYNTNTSFPLLLDSMPSEHDLQTDNVATVTGWINQAVNNGMWVIILFHRVDEVNSNNPSVPNDISVPSTVIQGVADYIQTHGIHTATDSEGLVVQNLDARTLP